MPNLAHEQQLAAKRAVEEVRDGMLLGLGTGRTAGFAIHAIAARVTSGLRVRATATSNASHTLGASLGLAMLAFDDLARVDLTIDGADEIDPQLRAIKGAGGALLREKVIAAASDRVIVIVDSSKPVAVLGHAKLPVEVLPFAAAFTASAVRGLGGVPELRLGADGAPYRTDNQGLIYDCAFGPIPDPATLAAALDAVPGIIGHGLFLREVDAVVVAQGEGVRMTERS